jgi:hypothetical protein
MAIELGLILSTNRYGLCRAYQVSLSSGSSAWPTANKAFYFPIEIQHPIVFDRFVYIGTGGGSGNVDIGIYNGNTLAKIISTGATAYVASEGIQKITVASTSLNPGQYFLGMSVSTNTATFHRTTAGATANPHWGRSETSAHPLPATATLAAAGADYQPSFGIVTSGCYV